MSDELDDATASGADSAAQQSSARPVGKASAVARSTSKAVRSSADGKQAVRKPNVFARLLTFFRQVVAELRKVIWPNKRQMVVYTMVIMIFMVFIVSFISGLDLALIAGVKWLFS